MFDETGLNGTGITAQGHAWDGVFKAPDAPLFIGMENPFDVAVAGIEGQSEGDCSDPITQDYLSGHDVSVLYNRQPMADDFTLEFLGRTFSNDDFIALTGGIDGSTVEIERGGASNVVTINTVHPDLLETFSMRLVRVRFFTSREHHFSPSVNTQFYRA